MPTRDKPKKYKLLSFVIDEEQVLIDSQWRSTDAPQLSSLVVSEAAGIEKFQGVRFDYGIAHPDPVGAAAASSMPNPYVGRSMVDAFSSFESAFRYILKRDVRYQEVCVPYYPENCSVITFGSPSSNDMACASLGYARIKGTKHGLTRKVGALELPVTYLLGRDDQRVKRNGGAYTEPKWSLMTPAGLLETTEDDRGGLLDDFLVISCVPNPFSESTRDVIEAKRALAGELLTRDLYTRMDDDPALREKVARQSKLASTSPETLHKIIVIGGLHGPGTGAAKLLLGDASLARAFAAKVRAENCEGKFWQAVVRVEEVRYDPASQRDVPVRLSDRIDVHEIVIG